MPVLGQPEAVKINTAEQLKNLLLAAEVHAVGSPGADEQIGLLRNAQNHFVVPRPDGRRVFLHQRSAGLAIRKEVEHPIRVEAPVLREVGAARDRRIRFVLVCGTGIEPTENDRSRLIAVLDPAQERVAIGQTGRELGNVAGDLVFAFDDVDG